VSRRIQLSHTANLRQVDVERIRRLLQHAFDEFSDRDWEHALGGMHALAWEGDELVGHGSVVQRRLLQEGKALRTGYVEAVAVRSEYRRHGYGRAIMTELQRLIRGGYDLGALSAASDEAASFYLELGWQRWRGPTSVLTPTGIERTPEDDGSIFVLQSAAPLILDAELTCDWRAGDVW
jgi:aminoglycoside 2'-N-acetyltransferase I